MAMVQKHTFFSSKLFFALLAGAGALVVLSALELTGVTHFIHERSPAASSASQLTKGEPKGDSDTSSDLTASGDAKNDSTKASNQPGDQKSDTGGASGANLITPSGDFVSAHHVNPDSALVSVCTTTAGASCKISFTSGNGTVRSLSARTTDRGGSAYWDNWTPASIGINSGTWQITATASLGGQTEAAKDALSLEVSP